MAAAYQVQALAEPVYYVLGQQTTKPTKYDSAKAACDAYRDYVQASNDQNNPGGVAIVKKYPREDLYPSLKMSDYCIVNWSRWSSSFDYWLSVYAGGCLPGRRPKDDAPEYFAEPGDCEPPPCPVLPLTPYNGPDPYPLNVSKLSPRMSAAVYCLQGCTGQTNLSTLLSSAYRPYAYQVHLRDVWTKWNDELRDDESPACADLKAEVKAHLDMHRLGNLKLPPAPKSNSCHVTGNCVDVNSPYLEYVDLCALECQVYRPWPGRDPNHVVPLPY